MAKKNDLMTWIPWGLLVVQFLWWNKRAPEVLGGKGYGDAPKAVQ